ncbi:antitoxin [Paenarthrobacter ureafaciens]|uniref:antitoxin n=1 Tax=Paenarthrobacter TaxID=1742992 RepID=UPI0022320898|nr:antitoxin [Paenarthrobacter sp. PAE-2]MCW3765393.1 antitoxin [Paenarthrobacter sp. PAE-2]
MELFNDLQKKARDLIAGNEEAIKEGIEKVGDFVDEQTDGKFAEQVDLVQGAASDYVAEIDEDTDAASAGDVDRQQ